MFDEYYEGLVGILDTAHKAFKKKNYLKTFDIARALIVRVSDILMEAHDSSGLLSDLFSSARYILIKLFSAPTAPKLKDQVFEFILATFEEENAGGFDTELLDDLLEQKMTEQQLLTCQDTVQKIIDKLDVKEDEEFRESYVVILIKIAELLGDQSGVDQLINQNLHFLNVREIKLKELLLSLIHI